MFQIILFLLAQIVTPLIVFASLGYAPSYTPTMAIVSQFPSDYSVGRPLTVSNALIEMLDSKPEKPVDASTAEEWTPDPAKVEKPAIPEEVKPAEPQPEEGEDDEQPVNFDDWEGCSG